MAVITVQVHDDLHDRVRLKAQEHGVAVATLIRAWLIDWVENDTPGGSQSFPRVSDPVGAPGYPRAIRRAAPSAQPTPKPTDPIDLAKRLEQIVLDPASVGWRPEELTVASLARLFSQDEQWVRERLGWLDISAAEDGQIASPAMKEEQSLQDLLARTGKP